MTTAKASNVVTMPHANTIDYSITENDQGKLVVRITRIDEVQFSKRDVEIPGSKFKQLGVEAPSFWSDTAVKIVASKYFRGHDDKRENSVKQLVGRVAGAIADRLSIDNRFASIGDKYAFLEVLKHLLYVQAFAFNSPVWFNLGASTTPQCSACFILGVDDTMESLLGWVYDEGMVFRRGSGSGASLSRIRHKNARLSGGGYASGPLSFAGGADKMAGAIKSGGTTRRAAKMLVLDDYHPDIEEFIDMKTVGEKVAKALISAGFDGQFNAEGGAYDLAPWQNANNSFRASDKFMRKVVGEDKEDAWPLLDVVDGNVVKQVSAKGLWRKLCEAAWASGDPGLQWHDTINAWNPALASGPIRASNPCSEYMFLDNTACNLASFNLVRYASPSERTFDDDLFRRDTKLMYLCLDTIVDLSSYPTKAIDETTRKYRTLGAGYANLGGLLMRMGIGYDTKTGRELCAHITSLLGGTMYENSVHFGQLWGSFADFEKNKEHVAHVLGRHQAAALAINPDESQWSDVIASYERHPALRNAQQTVLAPTGTIGFMMDVDTTGVEPEIALVKYKTLVGGGSMKLVNSAVSQALGTMGYSDDEAAPVKAYLEANTHLEGCTALKRPEDLAVFDTSFKAYGAKRSLSSDAHLLMMAAAQPFLSGAISKTVNMPEDASVEDIAAVYEKAWRLGLKAVAIYRDNCKQSQPLNTTDTSKVKEAPATDMQAALRESQETIDRLSAQLRALEEGSAVSLVKPEPVAHASGFRRGERERLPETRTSVTHKFSIQGQNGYLTVGFYPDGRIGEIFAEMSKDGSTVAGFLSAFSKAISLMFQYGVPVEDVIEKFEGSKFEPAGWTKNERMHTCTSVVDYIAKYVKMLALDPTGSHSYATIPAAAFQGLKSENSGSGDPLNDNPKCTDCHGQTKRAGSCFACVDCGATSGCG